MFLAWIKRKNCAHSMQMLLSWKWDIFSYECSGNTTEFKDCKLTLGFEVIVEK